VGNVFYSEQGAQFGEAEEAGVTRASATRKFIDFLRNFRGDPAPGRPDGETLYRDRLVVDPPPNSITVSLDDLIAHDADLAAALRKNPAEYVPLVRAAPGRAAAVGDPRGDARTIC
jgi:DNA replication licensing factor MCM5